MLGTAFRTAAVCFAPPEVQERWALREDLPRVLPTLMGAGLELLGGAVDLIREGGPTSFWSFVSVALLTEGMVRLSLLAARGRPVGSLLGLPFTPLFRRLVP